MESKQTAVEWYFDKMKSHFEHDGDLYEVACMTYQLAKEKEKEQISDAYQDGWMSCEKWFEDEKLDKETYGKQ